jgi:hypothetical protein
VVIDAAVARREGQGSWPWHRDETKTWRQPNRWNAPSLPPFPLQGNCGPDIHNETQIACDCISNEDLQIGIRKSLEGFSWRGIIGATKRTPCITRHGSQYLLTASTMHTQIYGVCCRYLIIPNCVQILGYCRSVGSPSRSVGPDPNGRPDARSYLGISL